MLDWLKYIIFHIFYIIAAPLSPIWLHETPPSKIQNCAVIGKLAQSVVIGST